MTCEETYEKIMNAKEVPPEIRQEMMEDKFGYTKLRKEVRNFLGMIEHAAEPEYEAAQEVTGEVTEKLGKMNFHDFFECINVPRKIDEDLQRHSLNIAFLNGMMGYWLKMPEEQIQSCHGGTAPRYRQDADPGADPFRAEKTDQRGIRGHQATSGILL
ncbi:MAG: hypothetical protein V8S31_05235 [Lachnospiraceae bacterium]